MTSSAAAGESNAASSATTLPRSSRWQPPTRKTVATSEPTMPSTTDEGHSKRKRVESRRQGTTSDVNGAPGVNNGPTENRGYSRGFGDGKSSAGRQQRGFDSRRRSDSEYERERGRERSYSREERERWRCVECSKSNDDRSDYCEKCDARRPSSRRDRSGSESYYGRHAQSRGSGGHHRGHARHQEEEEPSDRKPRKHSSSRRSKSSEYRSLSSEWPPVFESDGAAYIFDARSGFFYEGASDFFFDPKNKLYYGNKQKSYYQHVLGADPAFRPITQQIAAADAEPAATSDPLQSNTPFGSIQTTVQDTTSSSPPGGGKKKDGGEKSDKNKIAITIKKKKVASVMSISIATDSFVKNNNSSSSETTSIPSKAPMIQKKHAADIDKWAERGREIRSVAEETTVGEIAAKNSSEQQTRVGSSSNTSATMCTPAKAKTFSCSNILTKTTRGKPACLLCKRKFADLEKLQQHVERSSLHQQNLAKREANKKEALLAAAAVENYRDRAKERRYMHGPDTTSTNTTHGTDENVLHGPSLTQARTVTSAEVVTPGSGTLGNSNIGNKMLQKLGWKEGGALGRKDGGTGDEVINKKLKEDWGKIELLAGSGAGDTGKGGYGRNR